MCFLYSLNTNRIRGVLNVQGAHAIFFFETLKCARINDTSRVIRNPNILHMRKQRRRCYNRAADQRLCFCYIDTIFPLLPKSEISASSDLLWLYSPVCVGPGWIPPNTGFGRKFVSSWHVFFCTVTTFCLIRNETHSTKQCFSSKYTSIHEPHREKSCILGFQPSSTQTVLYSHRRCLEA